MKYLKIQAIVYAKVKDDLIKYYKKNTGDALDCLMASDNFAVSEIDEKEFQMAKDSGLQTEEWLE